ncbi:MAG: carboxypeptidase-like regulatory domain-containing protein [Terracidiphilus sp.]
MPFTAQSNYAVVSGSILDPQHRAIAGAQVHILARQTGVTREAVSNESGLYEIVGLEPGAYTLTVDNPGFKQATQTVNLEVGQQATIDWQLSLGSEKQSVTVQASGELLKTQDASVGEVVDQHSVDSLPLNGRMLIDLVLTVPGAHISHGAATGDMNALYWRPGQRSAVSIGGSRPNANYFLLDGATNTDPTFNAQNLSPSPDAVQEFQVETTWAGPGAAKSISSRAPDRAISTGRFTNTCAMATSTRTPSIRWALQIFWCRTTSAARWAVP